MRKWQGDYKNNFSLLYCKMEIVPGDDSFWTLCHQNKQELPQIHGTHSLLARHTSVSIQGFQALIAEGEQYFDYKWYIF